MKIALVIGHDSDNKGAYGNTGKSEFDFNHELIRDLFFEGLPPKHEYKRFYRSANIVGYSAKMIDLHSRIDSWGADISIEFHFNSFSNKNVNGHEVIFCSEGGKKIAKKLDKAFDKHLTNSDRGIKKVSMSNRGGGFCCRGKSLAIISEPFFSSSQSKFVHDGVMREPLKKAFIEFFNSL